jgi:hypothetical protein
MKWPCLPLLACALAGCGHTLPADKPGWPGPDDQVGFVPPLVRTSDGETVPLNLDDTNRRNAEIFRRQNAAFVVPPESAGPFDKVATLTKFQRRHTLLRAAGLELGLQLGKLVETSRAGVWRTTSRYVLSTTAGRKLAEAESLLTGDDGLSDSGVSVFPDVAAKMVLFMEHRHGAPPRYIVLDAKSRTEAAVHYVEVPLREQASFSPMHFSLPNILGIRDGKVFLREDGQTYAFPIGGLKEGTSLQFPIG